MHMLNQGLQALVKVLKSYLNKLQFDKKKCQWRLYISSENVGPMLNPIEQMGTTTLFATLSFKSCPTLSSTFVEKLLNEWKKKLVGLTLQTKTKAVFFCGFVY